LGTQSSKLLIKSQQIQCTNHLTFKECGNKKGEGGELDDTKGIIRIRISNNKEDKEKV
jgi:hypothetical protein